MDLQLETLGQQTRFYLRSAAHGTKASRCATGCLPAASTPFPFPDGGCTVAVQAAGLSTRSASSGSACVGTFRRWGQRAIGRNGARLIDWKMVVHVEQCSQGPFGSEHAILDAYHNQPTPVGRALLQVSANSSNWHVDCLRRSRQPFETGPSHSGVAVRDRSSNYTDGGRATFRS
jgi:hypothetical protein